MGAHDGTSGGKDLDYKLCSLEEAEQFSNRRNYPLGGEE